MKPFLSFLTRFSTRKRTFKTLERFEENSTKRFSPSDWAVFIFFTFLMATGSAIMFVSASMELAEQVPARGGTHIEGVVGSPRFINPLLATSETDRDLTQLVFSGLLKAEPDGTLSGDLASSYEVSPEKLSYTFTLREGAVFHDGTPVTAEDIVFTVQAAKNPEIKSPRRPNWEGVDAVAVDEHTVVFTLQAPYALFLENATMGILPKHLWESVRPEEFPFSELNSSPIGSGSFKIETIKKNGSGVPTEYRLAAFDRAVYPPFIANFIFRFYPNQEALATAFMNGAVHAAHSLVPEATTATLHEAVFGRVFGVFFNQNQQQLFTDTVVRNALDKSLDKELLVSTILSGYGTPLSGPLPPTAVSPVHPSEGGKEQALATARALLEEYGWERGEDGVYAKETDEGVARLAFSVTTTNASELRDAAEFVANTWRELGADVELQFFDQNDLNLSVIRPRKYDALLFGLAVGRELDLFAFWHASQRNDPGLNIALYANIVTDSLLEEAREEENPLKRREKAAEAAEEIAQDTAAVFLYAPHFLYLTENKLQGVNLGTIGTPSDRFLGIEDWYLKTEGLWPLFQY